MALANYSLPFTQTISPFFQGPSPTQSGDGGHSLHGDASGLLYNPDGHQQTDIHSNPPNQYQNNPYSAPTRSGKQRIRSGTQYLPPYGTFKKYTNRNEEKYVSISPTNVYDRETYQAQQHLEQRQEVQANYNFNDRTERRNGYNTQRNSQPYPPSQNQQKQNNRQNYEYQTGKYYHDNAGEYRKSYNEDQFIPDSQAQVTPQYENTEIPPYTATYHSLTGASGHYEVEKTRQFTNQNTRERQEVHQSGTFDNNVQFKQTNAQQSTPSPISSTNLKDGYPLRPAGFTKVDTRQLTGSGQPGKTQLHAVLDYDDDYYDNPSPDANMLNNGGEKQPATPLQGPILIKNGSVPVVPLFSYPVLNNGSLVQIPILWTALSLALGLELRGQVVRGVPCVKRHHQLFCPTAGNTYPLDRIELFIDENKSLMKRMYGDFTVYTEYGVPKPDRNKRSPPGVPDPEVGESYFRKVRQSSQGGFSRPGTTSPPAPEVNSTRVDACESKTEIVTPYWALNSSGKVRAVVNTMHFEQAIHQEVCSKTQTSRCSGDCGCEQKYKWHRLLAYDPNEDCAGIFMDWFLFPSCCVCRCNPL